MVLSFTVFIVACLVYFGMRHSLFPRENHKYSDPIFGVFALIFAIKTSILTPLLVAAAAYVLYLRYVKDAPSFAPATPATTPDSTTSMPTVKTPTETNTDA